MNVVLAEPNTQNEETSDNPHNSCGPACCASIVTDNGTPKTTSQVNDEMGAGTGATDDWQLRDYVNKFGMNAVIRTISIALAADLLNDKVEIIILHQCDGLARPVPRGTTRIAHWRVLSGADDVNYATMNPWGGINESISRSVMDAADLHDCIVMGKVLPKDQGGRMYTDDQINQMFVQRDGAIISLCFQSILGREPSQAEYDDLLNQTKARSDVNIIHDLFDGNETFAQAGAKIKEQHNPGGG